MNYKNYKKILESLRDQLYEDGLSPIAENLEDAINNLEYAKNNNYIK